MSVWLFIDIFHSISHKDEVFLCITFICYALIVFQLVCFNILIFCCCCCCCCDADAGIEANECIKVFLGMVLAVQIKINILPHANNIYLYPSSGCTSVPSVITSWGTFCAFWILIRFALDFLFSISGFN